MEDFEAARDRVLMGLRRETMALSGKEKEVIAYHEGGHAVLAYVLTHADPVHKVTILPTGMALGVTQQLPLEERHIYQREYIDDSLAVRLGGRVAEQLVYGTLSTGANNDLVGCTELARKMVREWGMSDRVGPMAWGSQGMVFLGEDLMHSRDYSDETSRVIDEEVERILRDQEQRATEALVRYRPGLDAVARALLEHETIDGREVIRLVDEAVGYQVKPSAEPDAEPDAGPDEAPEAMGPAAHAPVPTAGGARGARPAARDGVGTNNQRGAAPKARPSPARGRAQG
jgi:cell division protease FtsH